MELVSIVKSVTWYGHGFNVVNDTMKILILIIKNPAINEHHDHLPKSADKKT